MINLVFTIIYDIAMSLKLTHWLEFLALLIVTFLFCSPTTVGTVLGIGAKLGIFSHIKAEKEA